MGGRQARQPRPHDNHIRIHNPILSHDSPATPISTASPDQPCTPAPFRRPIALHSYPPTPTHESSAPRRRLDGPPSKVQVSNPSGVQPVHCPVIWLPRPDAAVRPAGVQPVRRPAGWCPSPSGVQPAGVYPSALSHPSRPTSAGCRRWGTPGTAGQRSRLDRVALQVVRPRPRRLDRRPDEASMRAPLRGSCGGRRGSVDRRTWAGWCFSGRLRPTDQAGQTVARGARRGDCARAGAG
jgi:hypothetical protein